MGWPPRPRPPTSVSTAPSTWARSTPTARRPTWPGCGCSAPRSYRSLRLQHPQGRDQRGAARLGAPASTTPPICSAPSSGPHPFPTLVRDFVAASATRPGSSPSSGWRPPERVVAASAAAPTRRALHRVLGRQGRRDPSASRPGATDSRPGEHAATSRPTTRACSTAPAATCSRTRTARRSSPLDLRRSRLSRGRSAARLAGQVRPRLLHLDHRQGGDGRLRAAVALGGLIPAIESAHAIAGAIKIAPQIKERHGEGATILINLSGRGDKDMGTAIEYFGLGDAK